MKLTFQAFIGCILGIWIYAAACYIFGRSVGTFPMDATFGVCMLVGNCWMLGKMFPPKD